MITDTQREKFKEWNKAVEKLTEKEKKEEAEAWIIAALNILNTQ